MIENASSPLQVGLALYTILIIEFKQLNSCYVLIFFKKNINHFK